VIVKWNVFEHASLHSLDSMKEVESLKLQSGLPDSGIMSAEDAVTYDLSIADYFLIQWSGSTGMEVHPADKNKERDDYQAKLTWNEVILDDFS
jgi:hypothetical protein